MSKSSLVVDRDCTSQCRSKVHAVQCVAAATLRGVTDRQLASYLYHLCANFAKKYDFMGRTVLHVAASCGKTELCQWLITCAGSAPNTRDTESGYAALHRALYYGYLDTAVRLLQLGANLEVCDNEDMTVLDMLCKGRDGQYAPLTHICQPYVWGVNKNYSLGTGSDNTRKTPELLDFTKNSISVKQVALEELHSVYVSSLGKAWSCGMGQGGRLGTGTNNSSLTPQPIKTPQDHGVITAAVALNHTLLLLENRTVLSFGGNHEHQLGVYPHVPECLSPRQVYQGNFSGTHPILGVLAAKYHSVFYSDSAVYVCGLNAGQLGRSSSPQSPYITQPLEVPLSLNGRTITHVATSTGAIVVAVSNGDIYIVNKFQCKKMTSKLLDVVKIACMGGSLDSGGEGGLTSADSTELRVVLLNSRGCLLLWKESVQYPTRCLFGTKHCINVLDFCLTQQHVLLVTKDGTAFQGSFTTTPHSNALSRAERAGGPSTSGRSNQFHKFVERSECYSVKLKRLANVFRGVAISADPRGNNYAVIQTHPKMSLTEIPIIGESEMAEQMKSLLYEASEDDPVHDAIIKVSGRIFPVHCFMLMRCGGLLGEEARREKILILKDTNPYIVEQLLLFLYTGNCALLQPGPFDSRKVGKREDPLKLCIELCNRYKIQALSKKLQKLRYEGRSILLKEGSDFDCLATKELRLDRKAGSDLYDVTIKSEDGSSVRAHKCVLVPRLDYFHSMFLGGWSETSRDCVLELPFPFRVLMDLIEFIYTDNVPQHLSADEDLDHIIRLLIAGDQLLVRRLKECCELVLISALTLRNAPTVLHLASVYNSPQLKASAIQFICLNLPSFLQSRLLEVLEDDVLKELSSYYRQWSEKEYRVLTPLPEAPYEEEVISTPLIPWPDEFSLERKIEAAAELKSPPSSSKKKKSSKKSLTAAIENISLANTEPSPVKEEEDVNLKVAPEEKVPIFPVEEAPKQPAPKNYFWLTSQFPQLYSKDSKIKILHPPQNKAESSRRLFAAPVKLSQKERKRLSSESEKAAEPVVPIPPVVAKPVRTWATLPPLPSEHSASTIQRIDEIRDTVPEERKFAEIIAHDKQSKANLAKMKSKSFYFTQLEERAIDELMTFYNAANEFDERITIDRVFSSNIDRPQWITSTSAAAKH